MTSTSKPPSGRGHRQNFAQLLNCTQGKCLLINVADLAVSSQMRVLHKTSQQPVLFSQNTSQECISIMLHYQWKSIIMLHSAMKHLLNGNCTYFSICIMLNGKCNTAIHQPILFSFNFIIKCKILDCHNFLIHISLNTASQQPNIDHPIGGHFCLKRFRCLLLKVEPLTQAFVRLVEQNHPSCSQNKNVVQMNIVCRVELSSF